MTTTSVTCEIRLAEAIQYLAYTGGDTKVIFTPETVTRCYFHPCKRDRELKKAFVAAKEAERKEHGNKRACA